MIQSSIRHCSGLLIALTIIAGGCSGSNSSKPDDSSPHTHEPMLGGDLVPLGDHEFNIEFVIEPTEGEVAAYVLDGHATDFVRVSVDSFDVVLNPGAEEEVLTFKPVAQRETGESEGDTSSFRASLPARHATHSTPAELQPLTIRGKSYGPVSFKLGNGGN